MTDCEAHSAEVLTAAGAKFLDGEEAADFTLAGAAWPARV
jgi:hypothetical protein